MCRRSQSLQAEPRSGDEIAWGGEFQQQFNLQPCRSTATQHITQEFVGVNLVYLTERCLLDNEFV